MASGRWQLLENGRTQLISRNGHRFSSFTTLEQSISDGLPETTAVIDGEICSLDKKGRPKFNDLLFHRGSSPCFLAFDLLMWNGKDYRRESLVDRKQELRRMLNGCAARIQYVDHVDGAEISLFNRVCDSDLEGIVAKQKYGPYVSDREQSTWFKIRNPNYSQWMGREKLFERERNHEPVAGWHHVRWFRKLRFNRCMVKDQKGHPPRSSPFPCVPVHSG